MRAGRSDRRTAGRLQASRLTTWGIALLATAFAIAQARAIGIEDVVDGGNTYAWQKVELPGTICGDGSQYRFWYYDSPTSNNLLISFEGGGACWDYATCSGRAGVLGAAHPNGIPTDYIHDFEPQYVSPLVNGADPGIPGARQEEHRDQRIRHGLRAVLHRRRARRQQRRRPTPTRPARIRRSPGGTTATTTPSRS